MATPRRLASALGLAALWIATTASALANAPAAPSLPVQVGIVDFHNIGAGVVHWPVGKAAGAAPRRLQFLRLSDPTSTAFECCLKPQRRVPRDGTTLTVDGRSRALSSSRVDRPSASATEGFIGVVVAGPAPQATRVSDHQTDLFWPATGQRLRLFHCLTGEALVVRTVEAERGRELQRFYLPLGMDVEADCQATVMPAR